MTSQGPLPPSAGTLHEASMLARTRSAMGLPGQSSSVAMNVVTLTSCHTRGHVPQKWSRLSRKCVSRLGCHVGVHMQLVVKQQKGVELWHHGITVSMLVDVQTGRNIHVRFSYKQGLLDLPGKLCWCR